MVSGEVSANSTCWNSATLLMRMATSLPASAESSSDLKYKSKLDYKKLSKEVSYFGIFFQL